MDDELRLVRAMARRDRSAWSVMYERHVRDVFGLVYHLVGGDRLQVALGKVRRASGIFRGRLLAVDPHRVRSHSKRHMRRHRRDDALGPTKVAQTFFVLDVETGQPVCFTTGTAARSAASAAEELLSLAREILDTQPGLALV